MRLSFVSLNGYCRCVVCEKELYKNSMTGSKMINLGRNLGKWWGGIYDHITLHIVVFAFPDYV